MTLAAYPSNLGKGFIESRLYFLKQLKRAGAGIDDLLYLYCSVIRLVLG